MKTDFTTYAIAVVLGIILFAGLAFTFIWTINSLAELGGASFHIPHTLKSYFVALVSLFLIRGRVPNSKRSKKWEI